MNTVTFRGKTADARKAAFDNVAPLSFGETVARADCIAAISVVLGNRPNDTLVKATRHEWAIGRIAARLVSGKTCPRDCKTPDARLGYARLIVDDYQAPYEGKGEAPPLRKGKKGRRTVDQHKLIRACDEAWSQVAAELGLGNAKTQKEKNEQKAKRAAHHNASDSKPDASDLPPPSAMTSANVVGHVLLQLSALNAFCDKHAKLMPIEMSETRDGLAKLAKLATTNAKAFEARETKPAKK